MHLAWTLQLLAKLLRPLTAVALRGSMIMRFQFQVFKILRLVLGTCALSFFLHACGNSDADPIVAQCRSEGCQMKSNGVDIELKMDELSPNTEYVISIISQMPNEASNFLNISVTTPSLPTPESEVQLKTRVNQWIQAPIQALLSLNRVSEPAWSDADMIYGPLPFQARDGVVATSTREIFIPHVILDPTQKRSRTAVSMHEWAPGPYAQVLSDSEDSLKKFYIDPEEATACLNEQTAWLESTLGRLDALVPRKPVQFAFTNLLSPGVVGLFDPFDLYPGQESNNRPILYLAPKPDTFCATGLHELAHLYRHLILNRQATRPYGITMDPVGFNEALANFAEQATLNPNQVSQRIFDFLRNPMGASFDISPKFGIDQMLASRGLNVALLNWAMAKKNIPLRFDSPQFRNAYRQLITSSRIGLVNLAAFAELSVDDLLHQFMADLSRSLYQLEAANAFFPPLEIGNSLNRKTFAGLRIIDRSSDPRKIIADARDLIRLEEMGVAFPQHLYLPFFHPLASNIPTLVSNRSDAIPGMGIAMYSYIAPQREALRNSKIWIQSTGPFSIKITPVRTIQTL